VTNGINCLATTIRRGRPANEFERDLVEEFEFVEG
jgi:hypothetical protein